MGCAKEDDMKKLLFTGLLVAFVFTVPGLSYAKTVGC